MSYIIHANGKGAVIDIPAETTSEQYGEIHEAFAQQYGKRGVPFASIVKQWPTQVIRGVFYNWGLAGADGAYYELFQFPDNSDEDVKFAEDKIRREQDVVRLHIIKLDRVQFELPAYKN